MEEGVYKQIFQNIFICLFFKVGCFIWEYVYIGFIFEGTEIIRGVFFGVNMSGGPIPIAAIAMLIIGRPNIRKSSKRRKIFK